MHLVVREMLHAKTKLPTNIVQDCVILRMSFPKLHLQDAVCKEEVNAQVERWLKADYFRFKMRILARNGTRATQSQLTQAQVRFLKR